MSGMKRRRAAERPAEGSAGGRSAFVRLAPCKQCSEPIPAGAKLCRHCHSHQDWRRHLNISSTVLALLVALVSVLSAGVPVLVSALGSPASRLSLSNAVVSNETLFLVATNTGERPAAIQGGFLESRFFEAELVLRSPADAFVAPGARQVGLFPRVQMTVAETREKSAAMLRAMNRNGSSPTGTATVFVQQSDGSITEVRVPVSLMALQILLDDHLVRCARSAAPPTLENGCASFEAARQENDRLNNAIAAANSVSPNRTGR